MEINITVEQEVRLTFEEFIRESQTNDVGDYIQEICDYYETYQTDCRILNKILHILNTNGGTRFDLDLIDDINLKKLCKTLGYDLVKEI